MDEYSLESLLRPAFANQATVLKSFIENLPAFSPAATKIVQLSGTLNAPPSEIVGAIRLDPVLTGRVLVLVNSAYFSPAERVTSLSRAVVTLGVNTIKNLALSCAVMDAVGGKTKELKVRLLPAWRHSLVTAVCAKNVAKLAGLGKEQWEEYFVLGLLHYVGRIVLVQAFPEAFPRESNLSLSEERGLFGTDHCEVGGDLLDRWKFSSEFVSAVRVFPNPIGDSKNSYVLNLASTVASRWSAKTANNTPTDSYESRALSMLTLSEDVLDSEFPAISDLVEKASAFLGNA